MGYWILSDCDSDSDSESDSDSDGDDLVYFCSAYIPYIFTFSTNWLNQSERMKTGEKNSMNNTRYEFSTERTKKC